MSSMDMCLSLLDALILFSLLLLVLVLINVIYCVHENDYDTLKQAAVALVMVLSFFFLLIITRILFTS